MTAWVRVCSNGYGYESLNKPGFVMYGGKDFYQTYGFQKGFESIIGYMPDGTPHTIENDPATSQYPINVPTPEIERITATIQKELLRRVRIEWTCFSFKQLEYMTPYLLVPGISVIVEWGWNHFNPLSLLDLKNDTELEHLYNNPYPLYTDHILKSRGNYEVLFGMITNFEWSIDGNKIKCATEITSKDRIWAGQVVSANMLQNLDGQTTQSEEDKKTKPVRVVDSLKKFVTTYVDRFKELADLGNEEPDDVLDRLVNGTSISNQTVKTKPSSGQSALINDRFSWGGGQKKEKEEVNQPNAGTTDELGGFINYVRKYHPENYKTYLFGVFTGRNAVAGKIKSGKANTEKDFDNKSRSNVWINAGLVVEIINYRLCEFLGMNKQPLFRVDVDDCVISGHPNLISTDSNILLIPNEISPKVFSGVYGELEYERKTKKGLDSALKTASISYPPTSNPDRRLQRIAGQFLNVLRDDISSLINCNRIRAYEEEGTQEHFEFPFSSDYTQTEDGSVRVYKSKYTGFFKNLYINTKILINILNDPAVVTYQHVYDALFDAINSAASNFWRFKLVGSTGRFSTEKLATMKVIDENFTQYTSNDGKIFTFDFYAADGLIQNISFRPMLSNSQAIRTIYAQTTSGKNNPLVLSDASQLLDYKFKDKFLKKSNESQPATDYFKTDTFRASMGQLQSVDPVNEMVCQITTETADGKVLIRRLALPPSHADVLTLLLDDQDIDNNPRYCAIMPGIQAEFTIQGIAGIRTFAMFRVRGLPEPYSENSIVFRVINVNDTVQNGQWTTTIVAGVLPLNKYFKSRLHAQ